MTVIFEGPDNVGKGTQIRKIQPLLTDKPIHVLHYMNIKGFDSMSDVRAYSEDMYRSMFHIANTFYFRDHFVMDRAHIGEVVYSPMYRNYDGSYVYNIEREFMNFPKFWNTVHLITFVDKPENLIKRDDGLSFSTQLDKKQAEIDAFIEATNNSNIKNKLILDIDGKNEDEVFDIIRNFIQR